VKTFDNQTITDDAMVGHVPAKVLVKHGLLKIAGEGGLLDLIKEYPAISAAPFKSIRNEKSLLEESIKNIIAQENTHTQELVRQKEEVDVPQLVLHTAFLHRNCVFCKTSEEAPGALRRIFYFFGADSPVEVPCRKCKRETTLAYRKWKVWEGQERDKIIADLIEKQKPFFKDMEKAYAKMEKHLKDYSDLNFPAAYYHLLQTQNVHYSELERKSSCLSPEFKTKLSAASTVVKGRLAAVEGTQVVKAGLIEYNEYIRERMENSEEVSLEKSMFEDIWRDTEANLKSRTASSDTAGVADAV
jgi:hypothetical protein